MEHRGSSDAPQRLSPRAPLHLKTTASSDANGVHKPIVERSSKFEDRRSPRSPLPEPVKKKGGTRVADLESKLGKAQEELKKLRDRLSSAESAKVDAELALEKAKKQIPSLNAVTAKEIVEVKTTPEVSQDLKANAIEESLSSMAATVTDDSDVLVPKGRPENDDDECESKQIEEDIKMEVVVDMNKDADDTGNADVSELEPNNKVHEDNTEDGSQEKVAITESSEVAELKSKLLEKEKEVEILLEENVIFKTKAREESDRITSAARVNEETLVAKLKQMEEELEQSRSKTELLGDQLKATEIAKSTIEADMRRLRIQTEQWRKAAEAAAAVIAKSDSPVGNEMAGGRRIAERCGSMDKHLSSGGGDYVSWESPLAGDLEDDGVVGGGARRKAGIRMFGDLWKKKGQLK